MHYFVDSQLHVSLWIRKGATENGILMLNFKKFITICVSSCSRAVSGSPPVGFDAESWVSILVSSKRKSSISLWKPWAFWEKTLARSVVNSSFKSKLSKWPHEESLWGRNFRLLSGRVVLLLDDYGANIFTYFQNWAESFRPHCNRDVCYNLMNWLTKVLLNMDREGPDLIQEITKSVNKVCYSKDLLTLNSR